MQVTFTINKDAVITEVERLTHYAGARKVVAKEGDDAYGRMSATDSDRDMLEQFWKAACAAATEKLIHYARAIENDISVSPQAYEAVMNMPSLYDTNLNESIEDSLQNFFINLIASKWYKITSPDDEAKYAAEALSYMQDIELKMYHRKRPTR